MRTLSVLSVIFLSAILTTCAPIRHKVIPAEVAWAKSYGGAGTDYISSVQQTTDGGYIVAGWTFSFGIGVYCDFWVLKLNSDHTVAWQKRYGGIRHDCARSIQQTSDGGYIVAGETYSFGTGDGDFWLVKLNSDGTVAWQKTYGGTNEDSASSIQQTSDGGYIVTGITGSFGAGGWDFWILNLNSDGKVAWQKTYGGTDYDHAKSIQQTSDGGYVVAGCTGGGFWVLKLKSDGTVAWQKRYGGAKSGEARSIQQTNDGGYIVAGTTSSFGAGDRDFWVLKLNSDGTVSWQKAYGGTGWDGALSIQQTRDGGYIVAGATASFGAGDCDFWVMKLKSDGTVAWQKAYGSARDDYACSIQETTGGGYIVSGDTESFGAGDYDFWVLKLKSDWTIAFNPVSGAYVKDTNALPVDTNCTVTDTTATVTDTSATVTDTNAIPVDTNATIQQQAP